LVARHHKHLHHAGFILGIQRSYKHGHIEATRPDIRITQEYLSSRTMNGPHFRSEERDGDNEMSMCRGEPHTPALLPSSSESFQTRLYAAFGQLGQCAARFVAIRSLLAFSLAFINSTTTSSPVPAYNSSGV
jgi:hypothetical protein